MLGTASKPRLSVFKSLSHIYAQLIDDTAGETLITASTTEKAVKSGVKHGGNVEAARKVGASLAERALDKNIKAVVFDRGGYIYHGRVKALAEAARAPVVEIFSSSEPVNTPERNGPFRAQDIAVSNRNGLSRRSRDKHLDYLRDVPVESVLAAVRERLARAHG